MYIYTDMCILYTCIFMHIICTYIDVYIYINLKGSMAVGALSNLLNYGTWIEDVLATDKAVERYGNQMSSSHCSVQGFAGNVIRHQHQHHRQQTSAASASIPSLSSSSSSSTTKFQHHEIIIIIWTTTLPS